MCFKKTLKGILIKVQRAPYLTLFSAWEIHESSQQEWKHQLYYLYDGWSWRKIALSEQPWFPATSSQNQADRNSLPQVDNQGPPGRGKLLYCAVRATAIQTHSLQAGRHHRERRERGEIQCQVLPPKFRSWTLSLRRSWRETHVSPIGVLLSRD